MGERIMNVLVGCEESGIVSAAFRAHGHVAYSCDLLPTRGDPDWHMQCDVFEAMDSRQWDLWIFHPPCTYVALSGNRYYARTLLRVRACEFIRNLALHPGPPRCLEQPATVTLDIGPAQWIQPWQFGHGEKKRTGLYLRDLPPLVPTDIVPGRAERIWRMGPGENRKRDRSETYPGIAHAMADQWPRALSV